MSKASHRAERTARVHGTTREGLLAMPCSHGALRIDMESRTRAARDAGNIVSRVPAAVLRPTSIADVVEAMRFCRRQGVRVAVRGQGHTTFGQAQVRDGLVIDMSSLDTIHAIESDHALVDAGATWRQLLTEAVRRGFSPPVLTGFQGLSVGGTLSVGGIGGLAYDKGAQVDQALELQVVTGEGELVTCSAQRERQLFEAVLAGTGRCGVIVRANVRLVPAAASVRETTLRYAESAPFLRDLRLLAERATLDSLSGTISVSHEGLRYDINAISLFTPPSLPDTAALLDGVRPLRVESASRPYLEHYLQVDQLIEELAPTGGWEGIPHPWFDVFLPNRTVDAFLAEALQAIRPEDVGPGELGALGQMHLFPLWSRHLRRPLLGAPRDELVFLFDILSAAHARQVDAGYTSRMVRRNRLLFERARELGGARYSIAAIPFTEEDFRQQLGAAYPRFMECKRRYDPGDVLGEPLLSQLSSELLAGEA